MRANFACMLGRLLANSSIARQASGFQALPIYIRRRNRRDGFDSVAAIHRQGVQCRRAARACPDKIYVSIQIADIVIQAFLLFVVIIRCALPAEREDVRAKTRALATKDRPAGIAICDRLGQG